MPANLTGSLPKDTFDELLHVVDGPEATEKTVYSGTGVATALKVGTGSASVDNLKLDGNTISSTDTNGNIVLDPNGSGTVNIDAAAITGGSVTGITDLAVADGGTGASTAGGARTNLGLGSIATQDSNNVTITGGSITGSYSGLTLLSSVSVVATSNIGYTTGGGGTVTQATNKSTGVTLNKPSGQITMNNASLGAATSVSFTLTNSFITATDVIIANIASAATTNAYTLTVDAVASGSCRFHLRNETLGALGEALVINFAMLKAVSS